MVEVRKRKPSIVINGNAIKTLSTQNSLIFRSPQNSALNFDSLMESKFYPRKAHSIEKESSILKKSDHIKENPTPKGSEEISINDLLLKKIGITTLPEAQY